MFFLKAVFWSVLVNIILDYSVFKSEYKLITHRLIVLHTENVPLKKLKQSFVYRDTSLFLITFLKGFVFLRCLAILHSNSLVDLC